MLCSEDLPWLLFQCPSHETQGFLTSIRVNEIQVQFLAYDVPDYFLLRTDIVHHEWMIAAQPERARLEVGLKNFHF